MNTFEFHWTIMSGFVTHVWGSNAEVAQRKCPQGRDGTLLPGSQMAQEEKPLTRK
jgi:hypothetical protein